MVNGDFIYLVASSSWLEG